MERGAKKRLYSIYERRYDFETFNKLCLLGCVYTGLRNGSVRNRSAQVRIGFLFTRCLRTVLCRTFPFQALTHEQFQTTASLSIHQEHEKFLKKFCHHTFAFRSLNKMFFESKFSSYRQLSSVEFTLASFLSVPDENGSSSLHENFLVRFCAEPTF